MPAPSFAFYEDDSNSLGAGTVINNGNPVAFGNVSVGANGVPIDIHQRRIHVWNDKGGIINSDTATGVLVYCVNVSDPTHRAFAGTALNGHVSIIEARSVDAFGCPADAQSVWTPIGPSQLLSVGDMPRNSRRGIEFRVKPPVDYTVPQTIDNFEFRVTWM